MTKRAAELLLTQCVWLLLVVVIGVGCSPEENTAAAKFTALPQEWDGRDDKDGSKDPWLRALGDGFLIGKVGLQEWRIIYGYEDNNGCDGAFVGTTEQELLQTVSESLRVWMSPLAAIAGNRQLIDVSNVRYEKRETVFKQAFHYPDYVARTHEFRVDESERFVLALGIIFYCDKGGSYAHAADINGNYFPKLHIFPWKPDEDTLAIYKDSDLIEKNYLPPLKTETYQAYQRTTVHHEMGHAFGLGDTYAVASNHRFNKSTGGSQITAGKQPISVMAINSPVGLTPEGKLTLTQDDIEGIKWLYRYYTYDPDKGGFDIEVSDCPAEYVHDKEETKGCVPEDIFAFEFKYGNAHTLIEFMGNAQQTADHLRVAIMQNNLPLFTRLVAEIHKTKTHTEKIAIVSVPATGTGQTVMHDAAWSYRRHSSKFYRLLKDDNMPDNVPSYIGITPRTIAEAQDLTALSTRIAQLYDKLAQLREAVALGDKEAVTQAMTVLRADDALYINGLYDELGTLLHHATAYGYTEIVSLLLAQADIKINAQNAEGNTALMLAAKSGLIEVVKLLRAQEGIDAWLKNKAGYTAVELAAQAGRGDIVNVLLQ